jgi:hypothetical protein
MKPQKHSVASLSLLLIMLFGQSVLAQNAQQRDLTRYDNGGTFDLSWKVGPQVHERMRPKLRNFLWAHWSQKRLGHVVAILYSVEGEPITHHLFVEPDKDGRWHVVSEYESECCWFYAKEKRKRERGVEFYDTVERIAQTKSGKGSWKIISEGTNRQPNTYWLHLRKENISSAILIF